MTSAHENANPPADIEETAPAAAEPQAEAPDTESLKPARRIKPPRPKPARKLLGRIPTSRLRPHHLTEGILSILLE